MVVLGGAAVSHERGTPLCLSQILSHACIRVNHSCETANGLCPRVEPVLETLSSEEVKAIRLLRLNLSTYDGSVVMVSNLGSDKGFDNVLLGDRVSGLGFGVWGLGFRV